MTGKPVLAREGVDLRPRSPSDLTKLAWLRLGHEATERSEKEDTGRGNDPARR